jgi:hypothetical protein
LQSAENGAFRAAGAKQATIPSSMPTSHEYLDHQFLEMRARCLLLAADFDRIERSNGGSSLLESDPRVQQLRNAMKIVLNERTNRAEQVQMLFSDMTPPPKRM